MQLTHIRYSCIVCYSLIQKGIANKLIISSVLLVCLLLISVVVWGWLIYI